MGANTGKPVVFGEEEEQLLHSVSFGTRLPLELTKIICSYLRHTGVKLLVASGKSGKKLECFDSNIWLPAPSPIKDLVSTEVLSSLKDCRIFHTSPNEILLLNFADSYFVKLDFVLNKVTKLPLPLSEDNYYSVMPTMVGAGPRCWFVGGAQEIEFMRWESASKSVQYFDSHKNIWTRARPMLTGRVSPAVAGSEEAICVLGGCDAEGNSLKTVERYNVNTDRWTVLPMMNEARTKFTACFWKNRLYAFGGDQSGTSVEYWSDDTKQWTFSSRMNLPLGGCFSGLEAVAGGDFIYICVKNSNSVFCFSPLHDSWEKLAPPTQCKKIQVALAISCSIIDIKFQR